KHLWWVQRSFGRRMQTASGDYRICAASEVKAMLHRPLLSLKICRQKNRGLANQRRRLPRHKRKQPHPRKSGEKPKPRGRSFPRFTKSVSRTATFVSLVAPTTLSQISKALDFGRQLAML